MQTVMQIKIQCEDAIKAGQTHTSFLVKGRMPKGWPRGEFVAETERGNIKAFDCRKVLNWIEANKPSNLRPNS